MTTALLLGTLMAIADLSLPGPFAVGTSERTVQRPGGATFQAALYYPAVQPGAGTAPDPGAAPAGIVTFGHGYLQAVSQYDSTLRHLASHGFFVIASRSASGFFPNHLAFAEDLSSCITHLLDAGEDPDSPFFGLFNSEAIAASGHSMGGGASILCAQLDPRVRTVVNLAAAETNTSAIAAAAALNIPLRFIVGNQDSITPTGAHAGPMFDAAPGARQLVTIEGGFHCGFTDASFFGCDSGSITRAQQLSLTRRLMTEHLLLHLCGDQALWPQVWGPDAESVSGLSLDIDPRLSVETTETNIEGVAGGSILLPVTITNDRPEATSVLVRAEAAGAESMQILPALDANERITIDLVIDLPSNATPGSVPLLLSAQAEDRANAWSLGSLTVLPPAGLPGDLNGDGLVDLQDLLILLASWGPCPDCPADGNGDGTVDLNDLLTLLDGWS